MEISSRALLRRKLPDHDEVLAATIEATGWHLAYWNEVEAAIQSAFV